MVMTPHMKWGIAGVIIALILFIWLPAWIPAVLLVIAIGVPIAAWRMLSPEQRRRIRRMRERKQIGN
jgi:Flp pilus assembly protein TadB